MMWVLIVCCWIVSFFFNGVESGLLSIDPVRLRENAKRRVPAALRLERLLERPERLLVTVLLFTNAADVMGLLLLIQQFVRAKEGSGFVYAFLVALPIYLFVLGVLPKALFRRFPFRALARLAGILEIATLILWPILELGARLGALLLPRRIERGRLFAAREELKQITTESEKAGTLTATERAMIHNVVDYRGVRVGDVMVPLEKVAAVQPDTPVEKAIELSATSGLDRLPVVSPNGDPAGLINVLDVLLEKNGATSIGSFMRRIVTATADEPAYRIVQRLRAARQGLAAVVDTQRRLCGIVTLEDLVKRLVSSSEARV